MNDRSCIVTSRQLPADEMIRFVADPDGTRWILPSRTESAHADLAVHVVPEWALPAHLDGAGP